MSIETSRKQAHKEQIKIFVQTHPAKQHYFVLWHIKPNQLPAHHTDKLCTSFTRYSEQNQYLCYETHQSIDTINDQTCLYRKKDLIEVTANVHFVAPIQQS